MTRWICAKNFFSEFRRKHLFIITYIENTAPGKSSSVVNYESGKGKKYPVIALLL